MSRSTPFHKQTDPNKQAGQHVYSFDREPYLKHSNVAPYEPRVEQTLNEYIARKTNEPKKITFDEWYQEYFDVDLKNAINLNHYQMHLVCWNTAVRCGKVS